MGTEYLLFSFHILLALVLHGFQTLAILFLLLALGFLSLFPQPLPFHLLRQFLW